MYILYICNIMIYGLWSLHSFHLDTYIHDQYVNSRVSISAVDNAPQLVLIMTLRMFITMTPCKNYELLHKIYES